MNGESDYRYAWKLFESAKDFDDLVSKERYLKQAYGAAYLAYNLGYGEADGLIDKIKDYAKIFDFNVG